MVSAIKTTVSTLVILLVLCVGVSIVIGTKSQQKQHELSVKYQDAQKSLDSLQYRYNLASMDLINERNRVDSLLYELELKETKLNNITVKYEKIRKNISSFTLNDHIEFFTNELSTDFDIK